MIAGSHGESTISCVRRRQALRQFAFPPAMPVRSCRSTPSPALGGVRVPDVGLANVCVVLSYYLAFLSSRVPKSLLLRNSGIRVSRWSGFPGSQGLTVPSTTPPPEPLVQNESLELFAVLG